MDNSSHNSYSDELKEEKYAKDLKHVMTHLDQDYLFITIRYQNQKDLSLINTDGYKEDEFCYVEYDKRINKVLFTLADGCVKHSCCESD